MYVCLNDACHFWLYSKYTQNLEQKLINSSISIDDNHRPILFFTKLLGYPERCHNNCSIFICFRLHYFRVGWIGVEAKQLYCRCFTALFLRLYSHVVIFCRGYKAMLWRLNSFYVEAIQLSWGGHTAMLRRLYSHVMEAIHCLL